jgi:hypothetical protein
MSVMALVCVVCAGLAIGVLAAYGLCTAMFAAFRIHSQRLAPARPASPASVPSVAGVASVIGN